MGRASCIVGAHLPVVSGASAQSTDACTGTAPCADPAVVTQAVVGGVIAVLVAGCTTACPPTQGQAGRLPG